jgi:hypothetical protein
MTVTLPATRSPAQLEQWNPLRDFGNLYRQMGRFTQSTLGDGAAFSPRADATETDDAYLIEIGQREATEEGA